MSVHVDLNGWKERKDNPLSRVGVFPYLGRDIPGAPDPAAIYYVLRPEEELADPECINSFKLLPWVDEHTLLGGDHTPAEQKGVHGVIGEDVYYRDGELRGNIKAFSSTLDTLLANGKRELSCGYRCKYEYAPGVHGGKPYQYVQRKIRGNHLALVNEGRMGPEVCVMDGVDTSFTFTLDSKEFITMADENDKPTPDGNESEMSLADVIKMIKEIAPKIAEMQEALAALKAPADREEVIVDPEDVVIDENADKDEIIAAMDAKIKGLQQTVQRLTQDGTRTLLGEVAARDALAKNLSAHVGAFDHAAMTLKDVAKYGVEKLSIACDSGHEVTALKAYLHNRPAPSAFTTTHAQDSAVGGKNPVKAYINGSDK